MAPRAGSGDARGRNKVSKPKFGLCLCGVDERGRFVLSGAFSTLRRSFLAMFAAFFSALMVCHLPFSVECFGARDLMMTSNYFNSHATESVIGVPRS